MQLGNQSLMARDQSIFSKFKYEFLKANLKGKKKNETRECSNRLMQLSNSTNRVGHQEHKKKIIKQEHGLNQRRQNCTRQMQTQPMH